MQKKLIALAIAGLASSAAFAQSNVTIYGIVDVGQAWVKSSGATGAGTDQPRVGRLDSNSSYIGFKGVEDLGNGLKAVFQYETGFTADNASGLTGGRDTFLALAGGFGTVAAGNLTHPLRAMGAKVELLPGAAGFGTVASVTGTVAVPALAGAGSVKTGADDRAANAIAYISPSFSGFTGTIAYVNGENHTDAGTNDVNVRAWQVAGQYENGPIYAAIGYHKASDYAVAAPSAANGFSGLTNATIVALTGEPQDARVWRVAAAYTFPTNTKVTALYDNTRVDNLVKRTAWSLGVAQGFGAHTVGLEYARSGDISADNATGLADNDSGVKLWTVAYQYALSKRTMAHARYSKLSNDDAVNTNFYNNAVFGNGTNGSAGSSYSGLMLGLRHAF